MTMPISVDRVLLDTLDEYFKATVPDVVEQLDQRDRETYALVGLGLGVQFALELGALDPSIARALIIAIHNRVNNAQDEHSRQAVIYLNLVRDRAGTLRPE